MLSGAEDEIDDGLCEVVISILFSSFFVRFSLALFKAEIRWFQTKVSIIKVD